MIIDLLILSNLHNVMTLDCVIFFLIKLTSVHYTKSKRYILKYIKIC